MSVQIQNILQWNCRSAVSKKTEIIYMLNKYNASLFAISETWLKPDSIFKINGFSCLRDDRSDGYGGAAILIRNTVSYYPLSLPLFNDFSVVAAQVNNTCIVSIYIPSPSSSVLQQFNNLLSILPRPFLILGDFNCHHTSWGCTLSSYYGDILLDILDEHNICILNSGSPTRRTGPKENLSAIDLSICTPNLASSFTWRTLPSSYGSDHFPILISPTHPCRSPGLPKQPRLKYKFGADGLWDRFRTLVEFKLSNLQNSLSDNLIDYNNTFTNALIQAADETFPLKNSANGRIPSPPWWDKECSQIVKVRKEAEKKYKNDMTEGNFKIVCDAMVKARKLLKEKKIEGWKKFCLSISPNVNASIVWQNIRKFRNGVTPSNVSGIPPNLRNSFLNRLAPPSVPEQDIIYVNFPPSITNNQSPLNSPFTMKELQGVLSSVKDSAPGEDGIPYSFLANLNTSSLEFYLDLINKVMLSGKIPPSWKTQTVIPILKPGKPPLEHSSYRPIALSPVIAKVAENLVKNRLEWIIENRGILPESQFGFRKGKSTLDSVATLVTDIRVAFSQNQSVLAVFLDLESAYDSVLLNVLKKKLELLQIPEMLSRFIINLLSGRKINLDQTQDDSRFSS
ncbi:hypothetical protein PYW08_013961 [Mythimna loreyi]|uniref:Uncharacterized protein n=1 Tax=Mythimna loreyi TaxID=667449 RepID=A0ACC2R6L3_9NEOP|nr:hypothetical protein PYW08_013961 [Mythimna loreyi]